MGVAVGIDLGTTFSAVAWINPRTKLPEIIRNSDDSPITPSVIQFLSNGSHICGADAKDAFEEGEFGCTSAFKRFMGTNEICCSAYGKDYTARELSGLLLAHLKKEAEEALGQPISEAVITVPAYFANSEREDTLHAAKLAGLKVRQLINEPTAAALNYGMKAWRENALIMVYDLGGGTFDVTLVGMGKNYQMDCIATVGDHMLGGKDWDDLLAELIYDKVAAESGYDLQDDQEAQNDVKAMVEGIKKKLSKYETAEAKVNVPDYGTVSVEITRDEFETATQAHLDLTIGLCEDVLKKKGLAWSNVTDVLLVGGSTRMPQVSARLESLTGKKPLTHVNPDEAVALGAAMQTTIKQEDYVVYTAPPKKADEPKAAFGFMRRNAAPEPQDNIASMYNRAVKQSQALTDFAIIGKRDVQAHGMGIIAVNPEGTAYINENIIPPNMPIPVKSARKFHFHTSSRGDNELEIFVLEGEGAPLDCQINAKYVVTGIRHEKGGTPIRVQYSYDRNSIIHVQARQGNDQYDLPIRKEPIDPSELKKFGEPIDPSEMGGGSELTIVMAVDVSGSMSGSPMSDALKAMASFVDQYENTNARIGVIAVSDKVKWVTKPTDDYEYCKKKIFGITCGETGYGNAADPFDEINEELKNEDGERFAIILADGAWNNQSKAITRARNCNSNGIETAAIGFGYADKKFLDAVSSKSDLSILTSQAELTRSFGKIAQSIGTGGGGKKGYDGKGGAADTWETND